MYHIRHELKRLADASEKTTLDVTMIKIEIARLKIQAGIIGLIGGAIPVVMTLAIGTIIFILKG